MKKPVADIHTHSIASGHAFGTIREMAMEASEEGLRILGVSEHAPGIPGTVDPIYFSNLRMAPRELYGVRMLYGAEVNILNSGTLSLEYKYMDHLDYVIAGIHSQCYADQGKELNTQNVISCMMGKRVAFISHPDDDHTPLNYELLVSAAKEYHVALEVNNSSLIKQDQRMNCVENYRKMLKLCRKYEVPVLVSSDAHDPFYVGKFDLAMELLQGAGFDEELILNLDENRLLDFIRSHKAGGMN